MTTFAFYREDYECPPENPQHILPTNRTFLYGEGATTTSLLHRGKVLFLKDHLQRLEEAWQFYYPQCPVSLIREKLKKNLSFLPFFHRDHFIKIFLFTNDSVRSFDRKTDDSPPNIIVYGDELLSPPSSTPALKLIKRKDKPLRQIGKIPYYLNELHDRKEAGCEVLYFDPEDNITEASVSNAFFVLGGKVLTPALSPTLLAGISRKHFILMLKKEGISCQERTIKKNELSRVEGILLTNSLCKMAIVSQLGNRPLNCPLAFDLQQLYFQYCQEYFKNQHD